MLTFCGDSATTGDRGQRLGAEQRRAVALERRRHRALARLALLARFVRVLGSLLRARRRRRRVAMAARVFKYPSSASSWAEDHKWDRSAAWEWNIDMLTSGMSDPMFNLLVEFGNKDAIRKQGNSLFELE